MCLLRRSRHRLGKIEHRLEILGGLLIIYLDLDRVIQIIREEDEPKQERCAFSSSPSCRPTPSSIPACAPCASWRRWNSKREFDELTEEKKQTEALLENLNRNNGRSVAHQIREVRKGFGAETALGRRRTSFADAPDTSDIDFTQAMVEREPITVIVSQKGWIRALKGHQNDLGNLQFKGGRCPCLRLPCADHLENPHARLERARLHPRCCQAARRARLR